jgi:hypothetical protein
MAYSKINIFEFCKNTQLVKRDDSLINNGLNYKYMGITGDGMVQLLREDGEICFTRQSNFNCNYKFKNQEEITNRFLDTINNEKK